MRKIKFVVPALLLLVLLVACTQNIQEQWNLLAPADQAKVILSQLQDQLADNFRIGQDYIASKPQHQAVWKAEIVPAFDFANKAIKSSLNLAAEGKITPDIVYREVMPSVKAVLTKLVAIGAIKQ